jgi:hypothetical protein
MSYPPNGSIYWAIWWFPDSPPTQTQPYTLFSTAYEHTTFQKGPIEIVLDAPVTNFSLILTKANSGLSWETTVLSAGHYMVAYDSVGQEIGRVDFDAGGLVSEKSLTMRGIRKVLVYPVIIHTDPGFGPIPEAVDHRVSFTVDCPPVADPIIDSDDFKSRYDSLMKRSLRQTPENGGFGEETATRAFYNPDTKRIEIDWPNITDDPPHPCHVTIPAYTGPRTLWTRIHSHVFTTGSVDVAYCGILGPYNPKANGGSLDESGDWENSVGQGDYIFTPEWIFRLPPGTPKDQRANNPFRWKKGANGCFTRQPVQ